MQEFRKDRAVVRNLVVSNCDNDNAEGEVYHVLLVGQILIDRDKHVEAILGEGKKSTVRNATPAHILNSSYIVTRKRRPDTRVDAFV